jgi:hypothetical protein
MHPSFKPSEAKIQEQATENQQVQDRKQRRPHLCPRGKILLTLPLPMVPFNSFKGKKILSNHYFFINRSENEKNPHPRLLTRGKPPLLTVATSTDRRPLQEVVPYTCCPWNFMAARRPQTVLHDSHVYPKMQKKNNGATGFLEPQNCRFLEPRQGLALVQKFVCFILKYLCLKSHLLRLKRHSSRRS